jgi:hypothetical protein
MALGAFHIKNTPEIQIKNSGISTDLRPKARPSAKIRGSKRIHTGFKKLKVG